MIRAAVNTTHLQQIPRKINALGTVLRVYWYSFPNITGPVNAKMDLKNSTTQNTLPISLEGIILVIIDRITVVDVESRNAMPIEKYSTHTVVVNAIMMFLMTDVNASET